MKKSLTISIAVILGTCFLVQVLLVICVHTSEASKASYLYNKWYFWGKPFCQNIELVKDGDVISLGSYPYYDNGEEKPIDWKVIKVEQYTVELLSINILDIMAFNPDRSNGDEGLTLPWSRSSLRQWLNNDFYHAAFSDEEKSMIRLHDTVTNYARYTESGDMKKDISQDHVYIPYIPDLTNIGKKNLSSPLTPYALAKWRYVVNAYPDVHKTRGYHIEEWEDIDWIDRNGNGTWWLRSPGCVKTAAVYVMPNGEVWNSDYFGKSPTLVSTDDKSIGVRPMICIETKDLFLYLSSNNETAEE